LFKVIYKLTIKNHEYLPPKKIIHEYYLDLKSRNRDKPYACGSPIKSIFIAKAFAEIKTSEPISELS
jgi:hypothetical protein